MEALLIIIFIIYAVKSSDVINNLKKENKLMSEKIKELEDYINKTKSSNMISNNNSLDNFNENTEVIKKEIVNKTILSEDKIISKEEIKKENLIKEELKKKKEKDDRIRKNTSILITGAVLIVLAAIVFLTSTWNAIPNFVKTVVIILLVGVFLGLSKIAKKRFNLEKASNTFFYIAMAYIPICLISCSIFSLFGEFLSIYGEGRYLYLTVIAILTSIIYFINYAKRKSKGLLYSSLISQVSAVVLFTLIFENNINFMIINLLVYNIFLMIVSKYIGQEEKAFIYISSAIAYIVGIIVISQLFIDITLQMLIILTLLTINLFLLYKNNKISFNAYLFNFVLYGIGSYLGLFIFYKTDSEIFCGLTQIFYILIVFLTEKILLKMVNDKMLEKTSMISSIVFMTIVYIESLDFEYIKPYMVGIFEEILLIIAFFGAKDFGKKIVGYLIPSCFILTTIITLNDCDVSYHAYIIMSLLTFIIGEIIQNKKLKNINKGFFVTSHIYIALVYFWASIFENFEFYNDVVYFMFLLSIYIYSFIKNENKRMFKYFSYISGIFVLYSGTAFFELNSDIVSLVPLISTISIILLEIKITNLKDNFSKPFLIFLEIITYMSLAEMNNSEIGTLITILFSVYLFYNNIKNKENDILRIIPMIGLIPKLFFEDFDETYSIVLKLSVTVGLSVLAIYRRKITVDTIFSGIYLLFTLDNFDNEYIKEIMFLVWSITNIYFMSKELEKDIFRGLAYICGLFLYRAFIEELYLDEYTAFSMLGIIVVALLFLKVIFKKYIKDIDTLEYVIFTFIYLIALTSYTDEKDGMLFILCVIGILILSYVKKYGAIFIVSILSILVNAVILTREFWFSVPWWIYLLVIGAILIAFAIKNESDENKNKINVGSIIKKVKDNIEK